MVGHPIHGQAVKQIQFALKLNLIFRYKKAEEYVFEAQLLCEDKLRREDIAAYGDCRFIGSDVVLEGRFSVGIYQRHRESQLLNVSGLEISFAGSTTGMSWLVSTMLQFLD